MTARFRITLVCILLTIALCIGAHADPYEEIFKDVED